MANLTVTLIQTDLHWEDKESNLSMLEEKILAIKTRTEVIVLPEMFSTGFSMQAEKLAEKMDGKTIAWMKKLAAKKKAILTGSLIIAEADKNSRGAAMRYYNRLVWMMPNGEYGSYNKRHRFAYAGENEHYTAGTKRLITSVNGWRLLVLVCYDLRFPVWSRQNPSIESGTGSSSGTEFDAIMYVANWPEKRIIAWKTLLQARAIENQCYVIGVNRVGNDGNNIWHSGDSMVVDPLGEILYHNSDEEDIFTITLDKEHLLRIREKFPFWRDADRFRISG